MFAITSEDKPFPFQSKAVCEGLVYLGEREGFVEVNWKGNFRDIFSNEIFEQTEVCVCVRVCVCVCVCV